VHTVQTEWSLARVNQHWTATWRRLVSSVLNKPESKLKYMK